MKSYSASSFYFLTLIGLSSVPGYFLCFGVASSGWFSVDLFCQGELFTVNLLCRNFFWEQSSMWPEDTDACADPIGSRWIKFRWTKNELFIFFEDQ